MQLDQTSEGSLPDGILGKFARLLLRQEDELAALRVDCIFMQAQQEINMLTTLLECRAKNDANDPQLTQPLRVILVQALFKEMQSRLQQLTDKPEAIKIAHGNGWVTQDHTPVLWRFQEWDPASNAVKACENKAPVPHEKILLDVTLLLSLLNADGVVHKFRGL